MKITGLILLIISGLLLSTGCSKYSEKEASEDISPPIYVAFDKEGKMLFGPISKRHSLSNGEPIPGTDHTMSVFCEEVTASEAILVFEEYNQKREFIRKTTHAVQLGQGYSFKIFDSIEVTVKNRIEPL